MLPYFQYNSLIFGPIIIQVWGIFVSLGIVASLLVGYKLAKKYFLSAPVMLDMTIWALVGGGFMARVFHILFYQPEYYLQFPQEIYKFWHGGASSLGGFVGAALAMWLFFRLRKFTWREALPYLDVVVVSLWLGWGIGRLGCFFIHDHLGQLSNFFLAINFPSGSRHDLGLYESLISLLLFTIYYLLFPRLIKIRWGLVVVFSFLDYAVVRFFLDFLRATDVDLSDPRYFHLTPAQWGMLALFFGLTFILVYSKISPNKKI